MTFDAKKSLTQNMKIFDEVAAMLDSWIQEAKKLEKAMDAQSISVDTLPQEVALWPELSRIIDLFKKECDVNNMN